jgi:hypothetical protein
LISKISNPQTIYTIPWAIQQPKFVFPIFIEDGVGNRDTLYLRYDPNASQNSFDTADQKFVFFPTAGKKILSLSTNPSPGKSEEISISFSPNPLQQTCTIKTNISIGEIKIVDQIGKVVIEDMIYYDTDLDFSYLPSGIYLCKIADLNSGVEKMEKLVKQ